MKAGVAAEIRLRREYEGCDACPFQVGVASDGPIVYRHTSVGLVARSGPGTIPEARIPSAAAHSRFPPPRGTDSLAPDKFKGTLTAAQAAAHLATGLARARPALRAVQLPVADGGDGTVDAAVAAGYRRAGAEVRGPAGERVSAEFAIAGGTAVIESAQAAGLSRLPGGVPAPLTASSHGVGELILAAAGLGAKRIVLGLGGVASTDGGSGLVTALGARLLDESGAELPPGGAALAGLARIDLSGLHGLAGVEVEVATDVDNPLLGDRGAAAVYGPQKGASPPQVRCLERGLARWADVAERAAGPGEPG